MNLRTVPDTFEKLRLMGGSEFEPAGERPADERDVRERRANLPESLSRLMECVTEVTTPRGKKPVLKAMVTTACEKNCYYCPFRAGRGRTERVRFEPDEMALAFDRLQRAKVVDGIFLSSGIVGGGMRAQDKIIETAEIIRRRYGYRGYVHLKIMPGAEYDQIARAMALADRVSINLEGPTPERLRALAPRKEFRGELFERVFWADRIRRTANDVQPGALRTSVVTQFVVGAVGDTDLELLSLTDRLYNHLGLARSYFSAFRPVSDTPFEGLAPTPPLRERRLYQASFLLRDYHWDVEDLPFEGEGNLPLNADPKQAYAEANLRDAPVDLNMAPRDALLRVPGIGPKGADAIVQARRSGSLTALAHLRAIGIRGVERAAPYILLGGRRPPQQLDFFDAMS